MAAMAGGALPMQLQHMLKEARIPLTDYQNDLKQRAQIQMHEYLKLVNIRTMHTSHQKHCNSSCSSHTCPPQRTSMTHYTN